MYGFLGFLRILGFLGFGFVGFAAFPTAVLAQTSTITGTIVDPDGAAVAGADVLVTARGAVVVRATSDDRGRFEAGGLAPDRYVLHVTRAGFRASPVRIDLAAGETRECSIALQISAIAEAVVVSAGHVDQLLSQTPASVTVIGRRDLEALQLGTVAAALARVPGLAVAQSGGPGSITSVFPRGGESDYTTVLVDGVPVNAFGGGFDFGHLTAGDVERIEVVRGPQSAVWGGGAIGGVVQIVTAPDAAGAAATAEGGSRATTRAAARAHGTLGRWLVGAAAERAASDGVKLDGDAINDDWRSEHASVSAAGGGPRARLRLFSRVDRSERGYPGPYGSDPGGTFDGIDRVSRGRQESVLAGASFSGDFGRVRPGASAGWMRLASDFTSPFGTSESGSRRFNVRARADATFGAAIDATAGVELLAERATSTFITGPASTTIPVERSVSAVFAEGRYQAGALFASAGLRAERIVRERLDASPDPFSPRPLLPADTITALTPRLSAAWFVRPATSTGWTRLRASAGLGIRPPDAFEIAFTDNPELKPERSRSYEAGVEHARAGGRVVVEATAFLNQYDDLIVTVGRSLTDASRYRSDNIANARARGLEIALSARPARTVAASLAYTWLDAEVLAVDRLGVAPPPFAPGDRLLRRPRHQAWAEASWRGARGSAFVAAGARGRTLDVDPSFGAFGGLFENAGYATVSMGGAWRVTGAVELFGRVTNLLDRSYEEVLGFPALPRSVYGGIRVAAGR